MTQLEFRDLLLKTDLRVYHNIVYEEVDSYIAWNLVGFRYSFADNMVLERTAVYAVNYYTKREYDESFLTIESVLERDDIAFDAPEVFYDYDTNVTTYAYNVEVVFTHG